MSLYVGVPLENLRRGNCERQWKEGSRNGASLFTGALFGEHVGGGLRGDSEGKMNFQGKGYRRFCRWVSLFVGVPLGNLGRGSVCREL